MLEKAAPRDHAGGMLAKLDDLERDIEGLRCAGLGSRLGQTGWRPHIRRALLRLAIPDRRKRLAMLDRVRGDLIFTLAMTRRLDRLYRHFPWLAAPHGAFLGCAGGALGALASLYECARGIEIGRDMKRRLANPGQNPIGTARLTVKTAQELYSAPRFTRSAFGPCHAAEAALTQQITSHVTVKALLGGAAFSPDLSINRVMTLDLGYDDGATHGDEAIRRTILAIHQDQPAFKTGSLDDDLIRHMGLTLRRHLSVLIRSVFPTTVEGGDFFGQRFLIHGGVKPDRKRGKSGKKFENVIDKGPWDGFSKHRVHLEMHRSMLRTIDGAVCLDDNLLNPVTAMTTDIRSCNGETKRSEDLRNDPTRTDGAYDEPDEGQGAALRAKRDADISNIRSADLRKLINDASRWDAFNPKKPKPAPREDELEDVLLGKKDLDQLHPVSDLFLPILWFAPLLDEARISRLARGMPDVVTRSDSLAYRIKTLIDAVRDKGPALYSLAYERDQHGAIICALFTGISSVTADLAHART